jgi:peroxiredoxin
MATFAQLSKGAEAELRQAVQGLVDSHAASNALQAGNYAPPIRLADACGVLVSLERRFAHQPVVLIVSRGPWCPVALAELQALNDLVPSLDAVGARAAAITPQSPDDNRKTAEALQLNYLVLSDPRGRVARALGLHYQLSAKATALCRGEMGAMLPEPDRSGRSWLPMDARYVIDANGVIAYSEVDPNPSLPRKLMGLMTVVLRCTREAGRAFSGE